MEQGPNLSLSSKGKAQQQEPAAPAPVSGRLLQALFSAQSPAGTAHDSAVTHPKALIHCRHRRTKPGRGAAVDPGAKSASLKPLCLIAPDVVLKQKKKRPRFQPGGCRGRERLELGQRLKLVTHAQHKPVLGTASLQARTCPGGVVPQEKRRQKIKERSSRGERHAGEGNSKLRARAKAQGFGRTRNPSPGSITYKCPAKGSWAAKSGS